MTKTAFGGFEDPNDPWNGFVPDDTEALHDETLRSAPQLPGPGEVTFRGVGQLAVPRVVMREMGPLDYDSLVDRSARATKLGRIAGPLVLRRQQPVFDAPISQRTETDGGRSWRQVFGRRS